MGSVCISNFKMLRGNGANSLGLKASAVLDSTNVAMASRESYNLDIKVFVFTDASPRARIMTEGDVIQSWTGLEDTWKFEHNGAVKGLIEAVPVRTMLEPID